MPSTHYIFKHHHCIIYYSRNQYSEVFQSNFQLFGHFSILLHFFTLLIWISFGNPCWHFHGCQQRHWFLVVSFPFGLSYVYLQVIWYTPDFSSSGISDIYQICKDCYKVNIGQTKWKLNTRRKEHFWNIGYQPMDKSALACHIWTENHEI